MGLFKKKKAPEPPRPYQRKHHFEEWNDINVHAGDFYVILHKGEIGVIDVDKEPEVPWIRESVQDIWGKYAWKANDVGSDPNYREYVLQPPYGKNLDMFVDEWYRIVNKADQNAREWDEL